MGERPASFNIDALAAMLKGTPLHPQWVADRCHRISRRRLADIANALVLNVGSGNSQDEKALGGGCRLVRLDYPATNQRYRQRPGIFGDAGCLPIANGVVDTVLLLEVLEHLACPQRALAEARRVLRPGGQLFLSVPFLYPTHDAPYDYHRYTLHGIRAALEAEGFRVSAVRRHGNSLTAALQLLNLAIMESVRDFGWRWPRVSWLGAALAYPPCLLINLLAAMALPLPAGTAGALGWFIVAQRP